MTTPHEHLGKLIGNTGNPTSLKVALRGSFSARRGEFVRIPHTERRGENETDCLGRITNISRSNILFSEALGEGVGDVNVLPGSRVSGETLYATVELIGFKDATTGEIRMPRRPLDPGSKVFGVDYAFLRQFYQFSEETSIHIGNLVGYERGAEAVPIYLDVNTLATEHLAVLAMTGSGKSYTVGRIIERLVGQMNGTVVVFDPHGEYGRAFEGGQMRTNPEIDAVEDLRDKQALPKIVDALGRLQDNGGGITVYTPQDDGFDRKYAGSNHRLALQFDHFDVDSIGEILPGLTEPQARVLDVAIRKWKIDQPNPPRDVNTLLELLTTRLDDVRNDQSLNLSTEEARALGGRSAAIAGIRLRQVLNEARAFYTAGVDHPTSVKDLIGLRGQGVGRLVIVDLQGLSDDARQIIVALLSSEILNAATDKTEPIRPCFLVYEEGHNFAPAGGQSISRRIIKRIAGEGRKFGVGFAVISQRPSKLDSDVTSQCNTLITMRIKNPDDAQFIRRSTEQLTKADIDELPALSTGEALISGRSIPAPLLVRIGYKALKHGGESPKILDEWGPGRMQ
ncbi:AAA-like domain protein [Maioricimonas rarisocia]|uniref:AAA-like domain protein n=1 Tax=Maioricimonas rarisocia TaxID=2528026 RepID=A0A517Z576_9PLAN|nr:ATP-binding protein [Maioricimonas rarisocia]QDU37638.1 AAA-like domain protein [Maioricimonas rarisocia]